MQVSIFSTQLVNGEDNPNENGRRQLRREETVANLQKEVNEFVAKHALATVQWLQSSAACKWGMFTQLTAIVSY